jgi:hypothetical protein
MTNDEKLAAAAEAYPHLTELRVVGTDLQGVNAAKQTVIIPESLVGGLVLESRPAKGRKAE